jgi:hypothetical protein
MLGTGQVGDLPVELEDKKGITVQVSRHALQPFHSAYCEDLS